ncbi:MAG: hypothetical protein ACI87O_002752, partial [Planctomycetota bacterium]
MSLVWKAMNLKSSLILFGLLILAVGAYLFTQSGDGDQSGGMENAISTADTRVGDPAEADLVGEGNVHNVGEAERQVVPEKVSLTTLEPEATSMESKALNEVFAQVVNESGEGLEGIEVTIRTFNIETGFSIMMRDAATVVTATTGEEGRIAFKVSADPFVVRIVEAGFVAKEIEFPAGTEAGEDLGVWELNRALVLSGQVVGPNGQPVAGARLITPEESGFVMIYNGEVEAITETDAAGRFTIETLEPGSWRIMVNSENYPDQVFSGEATTELQQDGLLWNLDEGATLRGRLKGRPSFSTQELVVRMDLASGVNWETVLGAPSDGFPKLGRRADLLPDGTFAIAGLHP